MKLENILPTDKQINILYQQLKKRKHGISHKKFQISKIINYLLKITPTEYGILLEKVKI